MFTLPRNPEPDGPEWTIAEFKDVLAQPEEVYGVALCASYRRGVEDEFSDQDIWVFVQPGTELSSELVLSSLLPEAFHRLVMEEGRDESWADYVVLNMIVGGRVINLKYLRSELLSTFASREPTWDPDYMENLENFWAMTVLYDRDGDLAIHQRYLESFAVRRVGDNLVPQLIQRYAIHHWRSVYQGVYRAEEYAWLNQVFYLVELLISLAHMRLNLLPPDKKWMMATSTFAKLGADGSKLHRVLELARTADIKDKVAVLQVYRLLCELEDSLIDLELAGWTSPWWRRVLDERLHYVKVSQELRQQVSAVMGEALSHAAFRRIGPVAKQLGQ